MPQEPADSKQQQQQLCCVVLLLSFSFLQQRAQCYVEQAHIGHPAAGVFGVCCCCCCCGGGGGSYSNSMLPCQQLPCQLLTFCHYHHPVWWRCCVMSTSSDDADVFVVVVEGLRCMLLLYPVQAMLTCPRASPAQQHTGVYAGWHLAAVAVAADALGPLQSTHTRPGRVCYLITTNDPKPLQQVLSACEAKTVTNQCGVCGHPSHVVCVDAGVIAVCLAAAWRLSTVGCAACPAWHVLYWRMPARSWCMQQWQQLGKVVISVCVLLVMYNNALQSCAELTGGLTCGGSCGCSTMIQLFPCTCYQL